MAVQTFENCYVFAKITKEYLVIVSGISPPPPKKRGLQSNFTIA